MLAWAHPSPRPKRHLDRFTGLCTDHGKETLYFTMDRHFPIAIHRCVVVSTRCIWQLDSKRWFSHRRWTGGRHNCISYLLTRTKDDLFCWSSWSPADRELDSVMEFGFEQATQSLVRFKIRPNAHPRCNKGHKNLSDVWRWSCLTWFFSP